MSAIEKERVDILLVQQGLFDSREQAKRAVMAGEILGENEERLDKAGQKIPVTTELHFKGEKLKYVSRGGLKLEKALNDFDITVKDKIVLDIGSSTGGFTDVALQNGAKLVYALDVGTNQLVWKLRSDDRVKVMENTNFRYSKLNDFKFGQPNFATIDVSFISLGLILPPLANIINMGGHVVALIKPQFEAGRENVGKNGIIKDPTVHKQVLQKVTQLMIQDGFSIRALTYSPIKGGQGNIEFLAVLIRDDSPTMADSINIEKLLAQTYAQLNHTESQAND
ncbi:MAG: TlyA family RNA methyltransferase [Leuconostoc gelidum]|jgi:23S rRNA (cytidine1920-2'-O)/16S rRNA (cytidine1409-2'-O)-methyltransferase|uniref:TlyA family RNA methyltransferase n=1 Tax=Leuconostoc gelidum TaxID=1244 RepID=UPI0002192166|nr:TlyA family RNA methyltransferase [Leuconostoc gelidum]AFS40759.1 rRNA methylase [Leuconostoc gelidum JB7]MBZ5978651.1 TlyA family RNA methyltransferase [Leuconostoc gelidum subsp. gelidum]MBZ5992545.1 TlyA family RNA methyltransferase [Leuconostoc gelidum subsp. gelidum]MBZ6000887.1 TlyA family RNA methyltransferase [Leuconostoc gelidum subsp. gelidum]QDJ29611.1 TlyA family rRNA (cytidine-2'-O)-methyltransferase [Leuconostoc gelidum subsp. gelidum]